jgi:hypothetical protein
MWYKSPLLQSLQSNRRLQHLSRRTEAAYIYWSKRFVRFCGLRHPSDRDPFARGRVRHPDGAGAPGASGCGDQDDLDPGPEPGRPRGSEARRTAWA